MDLKMIRQLSWDKVKKMGLQINPNLPELGDVRIERTKEKALNRLMCMLAVAAASYGFPLTLALEWLNQEGIKSDLEESELRFLGTSEGNLDKFKAQIEGMWVLAWSLNLVNDLNFDQSCPNDFVAMLPDLKKKESIKRFDSKANLKGKDEIIPVCDFVYCLHWAVKNTELKGNKIPLKIQPFVVSERRRALEWLISNENWYEVSLDT